MVNRYQSGWWLEIKYWEEDLTQSEIAELCDVSPTTIRKYMKQFGIPRRDLRGEDHPLYGTERKQDVRRAISETLSGREVSKETREKQSDSHTGNSLSEAQREAISEALSGISRSEETRRK